MQLIYVTEGIGAIFQSQVVQLLNHYAVSKQFEQITLLVGLKDQQDVDLIASLNPKIILKTFNSSPQYPFFNRATVHSLTKQLQDLDISDHTIVHCRGEYLAGLVSKTPMRAHFKLLIDVRGTTLEEIQLYSDSRMKSVKLWYLRHMITGTIHNADAYSSVTESLKTYLIDTFQIAADKITVNHCIAGADFKYSQTDRAAIRDELKVADNDILFIFSSGSTQKWQNDQYIATSLAEQGYKVLMLTKKQYEHPNILTRFVPQKEVADYLNAADIAIIIRPKDIVNQVASPVKFSEYLACGLPVIANHSIELIEKIILQNSCGHLVDSLDKLDRSTISDLLSLDRTEISALGQELFGIEKISSNYIDLYHGLLEGTL